MLSVIRWARMARPNMATDARTCKRRPPIRRSFQKKATMNCPKCGDVMMMAGKEPFCRTCWDTPLTKPLTKPVHAPIAPTVQTVAESPQATRRGAQRQQQADSDGGSSLEGLFLEVLRDYGADLPAPAREFAWCPGRNYHADFAWPAALVIVEVEGYGHGRGKDLTSKFVRDIGKYNLLAVLGWTLLRCNRAMLEEAPEQFISLIRTAVKKGQRA